MQKRGPWKIISTSIPYRTPWMEVIEDKVSSSGTLSVQSYVVFQESVNVLPFDEAGNVYLCKEFQYALGKTAIKACGGCVEKDESPLLAGKRELKEELGIYASKWTSLGFVNPFTASSTVKVNLFLAKKLSFTLANQEENEQITMVKMPFKKAVKMALSGEISHAPTCVLLLRANELLREKPTNNNL